MIERLVGDLRFGRAADMGFAVYYGMCGCMATRTMAVRLGEETCLTLINCL
jgi:hypothetical protein